MRWWPREGLVRVKNAARSGDRFDCPQTSHSGGVLSAEGANVTINQRNAQRLGDVARCTGDDAVATGAEYVTIGQLRAARVDSNMAHGGHIIDGSPNVLIGGADVGPGGYPLRREPNGDLRVGETIVIRGTEAFKAQVVNRLALVGSTEAGGTMLRDVESSGKTMTITEFTGNNSYASPHDFQSATAAGEPVFYGNGNAMLDEHGVQRVGTGAGSDVTLRFNPQLQLPNNLAPGHPMPNDGILFHEMRHGEHMMNATYDGQPRGGCWTTNEEHRTISGHGPAEADYLQQRGYLWRRTSHKTTFAPHPG